MGHRPDGVFLSNGPGDPAATGRYAVPVIETLLATGLPIFGICLGHQLLTLALGARTEKMHLGHRGANHPVKDLASGRVEITSQNHGFVVVADSLPSGVEATHVSLFDGSNEGIRVVDRPVFSVQYHPEASPGPQDSHYLFERFVEMIEETLDHLAPGGVLSLGEATRPAPGRTIAFEFIFQLTEAFQAFVPVEGLRTEPGFLAWEQWPPILEAAGFSDVRLTPDMPAALAAYPDHTLCAVTAVKR